MRSARSSVLVSFGLAAARDSRRCAFSRGSVAVSFSADRRFSSIRNSVSNSETHWATLLHHLRRRVARKSAIFASQQKKQRLRETERGAGRWITNRQWPDRLDKPSPLPSEGRGCEFESRRARQQHQPFSAGGDAASAPAVREMSAQYVRRT